MLKCQRQCECIGVRAGIQIMHKARPVLCTSAGETGTGQIHGPCVARIIAQGGGTARVGKFHKRPACKLCKGVMKWRQPHIVMCARPRLRKTIRFLREVRAQIGMALRVVGIIGITRVRRTIGCAIIASGFHSHLRYKQLPRLRLLRNDVIHFSQPSLRSR